MVSSYVHIQLLYTHTSMNYTFIRLGITFFLNSVFFKEGVWNLWLDIKSYIYSIQNISLRKERNKTCLLRRGEVLPWKNETCLPQDQEEDIKSLKEPFIKLEK